MSARYRNTEQTDRFASTMANSTAPTNNHLGYTFKEFTQESLSNIRKRRSLQDKRQSVDCQLVKQTANSNNLPKKLASNSEPEPSLASGQQLPHAIARQLPAELLGKPLEDIDPYYANRETFVIISRGNELTRFSASKTLYLFDAFHPIRRVVLCILVNPLFNLLVIMTILINCILMTIQGGEMVEKTEVTFTAIYTIEMCLKVLARGFIVDHFSYLRDPWNWLDFSVIIMAYLTIFIEDLGNLSVIRTFRVLRALKTVAIIPGMKTIVGAVIDSVKNLKDVVVLTLFSLSVFSLLGLQIYMGILTQKCIKNGPRNMTDLEWFIWSSNSTNWIPEPDDEIFGAYRLCGNASGSQSCPLEHTCLQGFGPNPDYGFTNFDTFGWALICSFRLMTQDFWEGLYMQILKTAGTLHIIFFLISIFLGSIYLMNLILAIVAMSYNELQRRAEEEEEAAALDEAAFLESCRLMELAENYGSEQSNGTLSGTVASYRPSVEIGLAGQSLLTSLCRNGLLGQRVVEKLNQHIRSTGQEQTDGANRTRSLSYDVQPHQLASSNLAHRQQSIVSFDIQTRKHSSSLARLRPEQPTPNLARPMQTKFFASNPNHPESRLVLQDIPVNSENSELDTDSKPKSIVASRFKTRKWEADDRSSSVQSDSRFSKQQAAMAGLLSKHPEQVQSLDFVQPTDVRSSPDKFSPSREDRRLSSCSAKIGPRSWLTARRATSKKVQSLSSSRQNSVCIVNNPMHKFDTETRHYTESDKDVSIGQFESSINRRSQTSSFRLRDEEFASDSSGACSPLETSSGGSKDSPICFGGRRRVSRAPSRVPKALTESPTRSSARLAASALVLSQKQLSVLDDQTRRGSSKKVDPNAMSNSARSSLSSSNTVQQLAIDHRAMHHLSVENFAMFGSAGPHSRANSAVVEIIAERNPNEARGLQINHESLDNLRYRLSSHANIRPETLISRTLTGGNHRLSRLSNLGDFQRQLTTSKDFSRRASDWSRMSMSTNVDLRRLIRLWAHTNPYQARPSVGSFSALSQQVAGSPARSIQNESNSGSVSIAFNSPRPSSVGSARQAYELVSAYSRRHQRYPFDQLYPSFAPDNSEDSAQIEINARDKSIAYCLSCLDILCIWECCAPWLAIQRMISALVFDPFTELFIILCILINTLFMALDSDDVDPQMKSIFERGNYFFTAIFAVEASLKIMALSPKFYFREGWNVFDAIIVGLSILELGLERVYGLSVTRSLRLLRVFKLAKSWPTLNLLISIMGKAVGDLGNLTFVLAIIVFIFAVMGMQLFGNKYVDNNFPSGQLPRWNFTDFMHSFMIVFRILCAEWIEPMWDCLLVGGWPCIPFFLIAVTVGNLVVLNLFLALLLASFGASNLSSPQADNVDTKNLQEAIARFVRLGKWMRKRLNRLIYLLLVCFTCGYYKKYHPDQSSLGLARANNSSCKFKSHIATMSKEERAKSLEARTEVLKSKIRRSPEKQYHLRRLAKSQHKQTIQNQPKPGNTPLGLNYNYASPVKPSFETTIGLHHMDNSNSNNFSIPIIVDEVDESSGNRSASEFNMRTPPSILTEEGKSFDLPSPVSESKRTIVSVSHHYSNQQPTMQPILEDAQDLSSYQSVESLPLSSCLEQNHEKSFIQGEINRCADETSETGYGDSPVTEDRPKSSLYLKPPERQDMDDDDDRALQHIEKCMESCICLGIFYLKWFLFRQYVRRIVEHRYFDQCVLALIVISSGTLALEDKHLNERPGLKKTLDVLDTVFTIIFSLEMIFKWLAFGLRRYFANIWSWLDFLIVLVSFINLMASIFGSGKIQALKTMRTLRAMRGLRPLRALQRFQGMRVVVNALIQAIPSIFNVLLVCLIFWLIFSIMGVQMFGGKFWRCLSPTTKQVVAYEEAANKFECLERNLTWANPQINFDNVLNAYLALFQVATFKGWIDIMNSATDSRGRDDQPIREANIYMYFYFDFFVILGSFFTLNLFIGVIIDNFNEQKKKTGGSLEIFMTDEQKKYYHAMKKMRSKRPVKAMTRPKLKLQGYMFDLTTSKKFDMIIMIIIGANMFVMALEHYGQSKEFANTLEDLNLLFIAIFTCECLCKIFAMRHFYFREPWNIFDFIVVALSILGVLMKEYVAKYFVSPTLLRVVRVVKVGRVLRLVKGAKGIRTLLFALAMSLPALFNICLLLFLVMFIYAIFGMSFFMNVRPRAGIDETFNFDTFPSSIIVLFQMSTSAGWDLVLDPLMDEENDCQKADPVLGLEGTCGNKSVAIFYLVSYVIVTFLIIINMYIAVILENYSQATEDVQEGLTDDDYEMYYEIWQKFDPDGTQFLPYEKLSDFVNALEDPLRIPKPNQLAVVVLDINIYEGNQCYCVDILDALTKYFFMRKGLVIQVNEQLQQVQSSLHETPLATITTTYMLKRRHYCARVIQNAWRKWRRKSTSIKGQPI